ncbi:MAG: hypothetical protein JWP76_3265 [Dactylosporangium sp.]|jgi:hypothetical protein|nr:hypothetical protein [Dactylosporangium sp.]
MPASARIASNKSGNVPTEAAGTAVHLTNATPDLGAGRGGGAAVGRRPRVGVS